LRNLEIGSAIGSSWIFQKFDDISWRPFREANSIFQRYIIYKISSVNAACVKERTCIKYKHSMRRIVETDCVARGHKAFLVSCY